MPLCEVRGTRVTTLSDLEAVDRALGSDAWLTEMLRRNARGRETTLGAHLYHLQPLREVEGAPLARCRNFFVVSGGDGQPRVEQLTRKLSQQIVDYCIPRSRIAEASEAMTRDGSAEQFLRLQQEAKDLFTGLDRSGEGGELLLYLLLESVLRIPQVLCKMPLKTNSQMHVHGADGVHATARPDGGLAVYWGESKLHASVGNAVRSGMESLAELLVGDEAHRQRDMLLVRDHADLADPALTTALRSYFDEDDPNSRRVEFRGACLVGFDYDNYPDDRTLEAEANAQVEEQVARWVNHLKNSIESHDLTAVELEVFFVPFPSVSDFRDLMRKALAA